MYAIHLTIVIRVSSSYSHVSTQTRETLTGAKYYATLSPTFTALSHERYIETATVARRSYSPNGCFHTGDYLTPHKTIHSFIYILLFCSLFVFSSFNKSAL